MNRSHDFLGKLEGALPFLPFMALGVWLAWMFIGSSGIAWISDSDINGSNISNFNAASNAGAGLLLVLAALREDRIRACLQRPRAVILGAMLSGIGCFVIVLVGPYYLGPYLVLGSSMDLLIFILACALAGAGLLPPILRCAELYGDLAPRKAIIYVAFSHIVAAAIYFVIAGTPVWAPAAGGPSLMGILSFILLPLLAALLLSLSYYGPSARRPEVTVAHGGCPCGRDNGYRAPTWEKAGTESEREEVPRPAPLSRQIKRLFLVALIFSVVIVSVRAVVVSGSAVSFTQGVVGVDMLLRMLVAALFILVAVGMSGDSFDVGRLYSMIMSASVALVAIAPAVGGFSAGWSQLVLVVNDIFDLVFWCILSFIVFQKKLSPYRIFGFGWGVYMLGSAAGWLLGAKVMAPIMNSSAGFIIDVILAVSVLVCAFVLFSERQLDGLFKSEAADQPSLAELMKQPLQIGMDAAPKDKEHKGRFNQTIEDLAEEYHLSKRETDTLRCLAMGYGSDTIADKLQVSWSTARTHTRNVYAKIGVHSKQELIALVDERVRPDRGEHPSR